MISIINIPQLKDNYAYAILQNKKVVIVDPAESTSVLNYINNNQLSLKAILLTHHHSDHIAGVEDILNKIKVPVYSPNKEIKYTSIIIKDKDIIDLDFFKTKVIATPGHTIDHVVFYDEENNILFSGDTLFRLGCGRVFEGTYLQMFNSLQKINKLNNKTKVYCGHEYTVTNLNFLLSVFRNDKNLILTKNKISIQLANLNSSIPFNLGEEKRVNPFLSTESPNYQNFKINNNFTDLEMFSYLRDLKNKF